MEISETKLWCVQDLVKFLKSFPKFKEIPESEIYVDLICAGTNDALVVCTHKGKICGLVSWMNISDSHVHIVNVAYDKNIVSNDYFGKSLVSLYNKYWKGKKVSTYRHFRYEEITDSLKKLKDKYEQ